jgi:phage I-like protein
MLKPLPLIALLQATLPVAADGTAQLLPVGEFTARDGRPGKGKSWKITDAQGQLLAERLNVVASLTPIVVDYDHATLTTRGTGNLAPASGWMKSFTWLQGKGLHSKVEWTPRAKQLIEAGEYLYISPVIEYDEATGEVIGVLMAALVNYPAILGMDEVRAALSGISAPARNSAQTPVQTPAANPAATQTENPAGDSAMSKIVALSALAAAVSLASTATEEDVLARVTALQGELNALKARPLLTAALATALGVPAAADEAVALSAITTLKTAAGSAGDAVQMVTALQGQLNALQSAQADAEVQRVVDQAIEQGKFANSMREQLVATGKKDLALLHGLVKAAAPIAALAGSNLQAQRAAQAEANGGAAPVMTSEAKKIAALMGITETEYLAFAKKQAESAGA